MRVTFKSGVILHPALLAHVLDEPHEHTPLCVIFDAVKAAMFEFGTDCTITSNLDGGHSPNSKHYPDEKGRAAIDFRWKYDITSKETEWLKARLVAALGSGFDVVPESTHLHVEHDPK